MRGMRLLLSPAFYHSSFVQVIILYSFNCPCCPPGNNCSLPGSSVHEISQARILEWFAISFSRASACSRDQTRVSFIADRFFIATLWAVVRQAPRSMGFSRQEYWSGLPFPSPGDLPNPGVEPRSPALEADALTSETL